MNERTEGNAMNPGFRSLRKAVIVRFGAAFFVLGLMFFLPAWTLEFWPAWIYLFVLFIPMVFLVRYLLRHDRGLLEHRIKYGEKQKTQKKIIGLSWPFFLAGFIIPGFDYRLHWSNMALPLILIFDVVVLLSYLFIGLVFKTNSYASRIIEIQEGQKLITTGPYALVRHPMYLGVLVFYLVSPLALGSYWAGIPALSVIPILIARIINEEKNLREELEGYREYATKTRYRLIPWIW